MTHMTNEDKDISIPALRAVSNSFQSDDLKIVDHALKKGLLDKLLKLS